MMEFCVYCRREVQPQKKFNIGVFIVLFSLGLVFLFMAGFTVAQTFVPFGMMGYSSEELSATRDMISGVGLFFFFICWFPYLLHYWTKKPNICPICGGQEFDDFHGLTGEEREKVVEDREKWMEEQQRKADEMKKSTILGVICFIIGLVIWGVVNNTLISFVPPSQFNIIPGLTVGGISAFMLYRVIRKRWK